MTIIRNTEPRLLNSGEFVLTPLTEHVSLHPEKRHYGINTVVHDLGVTRGLIKNTKPMPKNKRMAYADIGYTWEDVLEQQFKLRRLAAAEPPSQRAKMHLQKKFCVGGIHQIPDAIWAIKDEPISVDEYKTKWSQPPERSEYLLNQNWAWRTVTHCYARTVGVVKVRFIVCWMGGWEPKPISYEYEFHPREIDSVWDMVLSHRDVMKKRDRG